MSNRTDNYNRNPGQDLASFPTPSDAGSDWIMLTSTGMFFNTNTLSPYTNKLNLAVLESSVADGEVALTWSAVSSNIIASFRAVDVNNLLYIIFDKANNRAQLRKIQSGSDTQVGSNFTISVTAGDIWSAVFTGSGIDIKKNGTAQSTGWSSSFNSTATKHGVGFSGNDSNDKIDLFAFTAASAFFSADRGNILCGSGTNTVALTGVGTSWSGGTTFTLGSAPSGWSIASQNVISGTSATVTLNKGSGTGAFTVSDGATTAALVATNTATVAGTGNSGTAATWDVLETPASGNLVVVPDTFTLTVDANLTIGSSPSDTTTNVLTCAGSGSVTVADGVTFKVRGNAVIDNGTLQIGTGSTGGAILEFDASQSGTPATTYICAVGANAKTACRFKMRGISSSHALLRSNASGGNAQTYVHDGLYDCQYGDFTRVGDASNDGIQIRVNSATTGTHNFADCVLTSCGRTHTQDSLVVGMGISFERCLFTSGVSGTDLELIGSAPSGGVTRLVDLCSFVNSIKWVEGNFTISNSVLDGEGAGSTGSGTWASGQFSGNFWRLINTSGGGISGVALRGDTDNCYVLADAGTDNPHGLGPQNTGSPQTLSTTIYEYTSTIITDGGNWFYGGGTWTVQNCIVLPAMGVQNGTSSGALTTAGSTGTFSLVHCTCYAPLGNGGILIGDGGEATGEIPNCKSNIFWIESATSAYCDQAVGTAGSTANVITPGGCIYNGYINAAVAATRYQGNWPTTQPGANDSLVTGTPNTYFVDASRNIASWAVTRGSASGTYAGKVSDARGYLRANPALITDLLAHVRGGFVVKYTPWRTAAHDSTVLGAVQTAPPATGVLLLKRRRQMMAGAFS